MRASMGIRWSHDAAIARSIASDQAWHADGMRLLSDGTASASARGILAQQGHNGALGTAALTDARTGASMPVVIKPPAAQHRQELLAHELLQVAGVDHMIAPVAARGRETWIGRVPGRSAAEVGIEDARDLVQVAADGYRERHGLSRAAATRRAEDDVATMNALDYVLANFDRKPANLMAERFTLIDHGHVGFGAMRSGSPVIPEMNPTFLTPHSPSQALMEAAREAAPMSRAMFNGITLGQAAPEQALVAVERLAPQAVRDAHRAAAALPPPPGVAPTSAYGRLDAYTVSDAFVEHLLARRELLLRTGEFPFVMLL